MNEEELKKYIKEKFKEIHTKMLNKQFVSAGTLIRFRDACIEFGKQEARSEFIKWLKENRDTIEGIDVLVVDKMIKQLKGVKRK